MMRKLPKPCDEHGVELVAVDVFDLCVDSITKPDLRGRLRAVRNAISRAALEYDEAAVHAKLHTIKQHSKVGKVSGKELVTVYDRQLVRSVEGRKIYDRIVGAPKNHRCPLCDIGVANTLDHHLPKTKYPKLSVVPNNLVPACTWCQSAKKTEAPKVAEDQAIHPYFDDFESEVWLAAEVVDVAPAVFKYFVRPPEEWDESVVERLNRHLSLFRLTELFSINSASELSGMRARLTNLLSAGGVDAVRRHLHEEAASWAQESKNSWRAAMYRAAEASDWFCSGGFAQV